MGTKTTTIRHDGGMRFVATTGSGHEIAMDSSTGDSGPRPTEVVLAALGACTAMDVANILRKRRHAVDRYEVRVEGIQRETSPDIFVRVDVVHDVSGDVDAAALAHAIELSAHRYCTVSAQLAAGPTEVHHRFVMRGPDGREESGEVCVTGPGREEALVAG